MRRKGCPHRLSAGEGAHRRAVALRRADLVLGRARRQFLECNSNWSSNLRPRSEDCRYCSRLSLAISSFRCATNASALEARASASCRAVRSAASAAVSAAISSGRFSGAVVTGRLSHGAKTGLLLNYRGPQSAAAPDQARGRLSSGCFGAPGAHRVPPVNAIKHIAASCAGVIATVPPAGDGHMNLPRSSRLA